MDDKRKQIIYKTLDERKPYKRNPRKNDAAVDAVAARYATMTVYIATLSPTPWKR